MASDVEDTDPGGDGREQDPLGAVAGSKPSPPSWPRSLAPLAVIFAFSLAVVLAILAFT